MAELPAGHRIGAYEVRSLLGRGGMGEVYRAHDSRLRRDVAVKLLPAAVADDPDRLDRFEREARALAALSHPNIAAIFGVEGPSTGSGQVALVLELVEGETLAERLQRGAIPRDEAVAIARQIAEGLEAAHEAGIVHRDLKPANIKITPAGLVKLLDFGIAKVTVEHDDETRAATEAGVVIGTTAYMSPEQARGQAVDKRSDIWSFGCVLFDLLTGRHAFAKATPTDTLVAILEREPDWTAVPSSTPPAAVALLRRCLVKDPRDRLRDIGEARIALGARLDAQVAMPRRPATMVAVAVATLIAIAATAGAMFLWAPRADVSAPSLSFPINPPPAMEFLTSVSRKFFDLSPDGSRITFTAGGATSGSLFVQGLGELQAKLVPGISRAGGMTWSPDGQSLAFFADDQLKRVDLRSGTVTVICNVADAPRHTASWGRGGQIAFAATEAGVISIVSAEGGMPEEVVKREAGQTRVHFPMFLPDGRRFLFVIRKNDGSSALGIAAKGSQSREIGAIESNMGWIEPDILVSAKAGVLVGQRFDLTGERLAGEPFVIADQVNHFPPTARALFSTSAGGTIAYHDGTDLSEMTWFDRSGRITGTVGDVNGHINARLSPDGTRVLFDRTSERNQGWDLWIRDLARGVELKVTSDTGVEVTPVWLRDGRGIVYGSNRASTAPTLFRRDLDTGIDTALPGSGRQQQSWDVSPDGQTLGFIERGPAGNFEPYTMPLARPQEAARIGPPTRFGHTNLFFSRDGQAVAYSSNRAGRTDVYVASLSTPAAAHPVSPGGGNNPRWSRDGRELTYLTLDGKLMSVPIRTSPAIVPGTAVPLFATPTGRWLDYDPSPDGKFLAIVLKQPADAQPITAILNWRPAAPR